MLRAMTSLAVLLLAAPAVAQTATIDGTAVVFDEVGKGFDRPVAIAPLPGDGRLLVVEKSGTIRFLEASGPGAIFLDVRALVSGGNEQGLLGLAFDPEFAATGRFYVNYTDRGGDTQIVAYAAAGGVADPDSAEPLLSIAQPEANHNGGWLGFGPDGLLYIGTGDGGGSGDRHGETGNGQDKDVLLGKILRIDPQGGEPEIFAYGLRNPWRNAFDGDLLYIADVGQNAWEEVSVISTEEAGANLGWRVMEGRDCYPPGSMCVEGGMVMPVHVYDHDSGCSITGGLVYRGAALPALAGRYFFADWCSGVLESFRYVEGAATELISTEAELGSLGNVTGFGADAAGEMHVLVDDGRVLKMIAAP
jgi:glucose/arabinose dehydrogenase